MLTHSDLTRELTDIVKRSHGVEIHWDMVPLLAENLKSLGKRAEVFLPPWADPGRYQDEFPLTNDEATIQLFLVMIAQGYQHYQLDSGGNVRQWSLRVAGQVREGVHAQYACSARALRQGLNILDGDYLADMRMEDVQQFYMDETTGDPNISDLPGRRARFQEVGRVLRAKYQGQALNLFVGSGGLLFDEHGGGLVQRLVMDFPLSYGDWPFCKLSMTPARMLQDRRETSIPSSDAYLAATEIHDPQHFEAGADVARPFALIRMGVLEIAPELARQLANREPIGPAYDDLRASAILVCRELSRLSEMPSPQIAGELWATGFFRCPNCRPQVTDSELWCPHKVNCRAYKGDHSLFSLAPMVGTGD
jgi:Potential Queuosine, Q, salvage protein family